MSFNSLLKTTVEQIQRFSRDDIKHIFLKSIFHLLLCCLLISHFILIFIANLTNFHENHNDKCLDLKKYHYKKLSGI